MKKIVSNLIRKYHSFYFYKQYKSLCKINSISYRKKVNGEEAWINKWSRLEKSPNPIYYRLFSQYIGYDCNIVPEDICHDIIENILNPQRYVKYYADKNVFDKLFPEGCLPRTILRRMNGFFYSSHYDLLTLDDCVLRTLLDGIDVNRIIIKPTVGGISGHGVNLFEKNRNGEWISHDGNVTLSMEYLLNYGKDLIIQECVTQFDYIKQFNPTSINTLRLTLYRSVKDDSFNVTSSIIRIGGKDSFVDNAHAGGCFVGILPNGLLDKKVVNQYGKVVYTFNGIDFSKDYQIPNWDKIIDFAKCIGRYVPHHRLLALDLAIDKNGNPKLIEFNCEWYSMWLFQFTSSSAFGEYTDEIIEYCKKHIKELEYVQYI